MATQNKTTGIAKKGLKKAAASSTIPTKSKQPQTIKDYVNSMLPALEKALPSAITPERFTRMVLTALTTNPKLQECTPASFCGAMMQAAQLGLEPNTPLGQAYLIPYGNQCQFQLGYKGLIELASRSGELESIEAHTVFENDFFEFEFGRNPDIKHKPALTDKGDPIAFYATYHTTNGGFGFEVMSMEDMKAFAKKYSQAYRSGRNSPWITDFEAMAKKTVLKQVLKYAPLKTEFVRGVATDETVKSLPLENLTDIKEVNAVEFPSDEIEYTIDPDTGEVSDNSIEAVQSELLKEDKPFSEQQTLV